MYKLAIFDFDGTLVDSAPGIIAVMVAVAKEYGMGKKALDHWKRLIGVPLNDQVDIIVPDQPVQLRREIAERYREIYNHRAVELCPLFPDLKSTLETLKAHDITITIATSKRRNIVDPVLEHHDIAHFFDLVIGACEVSKHKPHPESVFSTLATLKADPSSAIVIGDSSFDLDMARNAGVDSIGVITGVHTQRILRRSQPISIAKNLNEVTEIVVKGRNKDDRKKIKRNTAA